MKGLNSCRLEVVPRGSALATIAVASDNDCDNIYQYTLFSQLVYRHAVRFECERVTVVSTVRP